MKFFLSLAVMLLLAGLFLFVFKKSPQSAVDQSAPDDALLLAYPLRHGGWTQVRRDIAQLPKSPEDRARLAVRELSVQDSDPALFTPLPETFPLRTVYRDGARLYLDFSQDAVRELSGGSEDEIIALESLKRTLAWNIPAVDHLQILIEGRPRKTLGVEGEDAGHIDITSPIRLRPPGGEIQ